MDFLQGDAFPRKSVFTEQKKQLLLSGNITIDCAITDYFNNSSNEANYKTLKTKVFGQFKHNVIIVYKKFADC